MKSLVLKKYSQLLFSTTISAVMPFIIFSVNLLIGDFYFQLEGVEAIEITEPIFKIILFFSTLVTVGPSICYSHKMGDFEPERAKEFVSQGIVMSVITGLFLGCSLHLLSSVFFSIYNLEEEVLILAETHYKWLAVNSFIFPISFLIGQIVFTDGDARIASISFAARIVLNAVLSAFLCRKFGISGIGMGMFVSTLIFIAICLIHYFDKNSKFTFKRYFSFEDILMMLKFSAVNSFSLLFSALTIFFLNTIVARNYSSDYIVLLSVVVLVIECTEAFEGNPLAAEPLFGAYLGEENLAGIKMLFKRTVIIAVIEGIILSAFFYVFVDDLCVYYKITDKIIFDDTVFCIRSYSCALVLSSLIYFFASYYVCVEHLKTGFSIKTMKVLLLPVLLAYFVVQKSGIRYLGICFAVSDAVTMLFIVFWSGAVFKSIYGVKDRHIPIFFEMLQISVETITDLRDRAGQFLFSVKKDEKLVKKAMFLIEEMLILILEKNKGQKIHVEFAMLCNDDVKIIVKDDGNLFKLAESDLEVTSLGAFVVSQFMNNQKQKRYLKTVNYNRNAIIISDR